MMLLQIFFRQSRSHLIRTCLLILGICIGVSGVVAIDIAKTSVSKSFDLSFSAISSRSSHQITGSLFSIPQSIFTDIRTKLGIHMSAPVINAYIKIREMESKTVTLNGIDPFSENHFRDLTLSNSNSGKEKNQSDLFSNWSGILISKIDAEKYKISLNSTITFLLGSREIQARVAGFLESESETMNRVFQGMVVADISFAQEILQMEDTISRIDLMLESPSEIKAVKDILPDNAFLIETDQQNSTRRQMSQSFETSLTAFSMLALFMGIFLIYNTVSFAVAQRRKLNGTLRALGATRTDLFKAVMSEVMVYAVIGSILGVILGIILGQAAVQAVCSTISDIYFVLTVSQPDISGYTLAKGFSAGLLSSIAAALFPAYTASQSQPVTLMQRSASESTIQKHTRLLTGIGMGILLISGIYFIGLDGHPVIDFISVFLIFFGFSVLAPMYIKTFSSLLKQTIGKMTGVLTHMAIGNIVRSLSRTSVLIASLMVVTSVYIGVEIMTHSFRMSIINWVEGHIGGDIHLQSTDELNRTLDFGLLKKIEQMPEVSEVSSYNIHRIYSKSSGEVHIFSYVKDLSEKEWIWKTAESETELNVLLENGWIFVSEIFARKNKIRTEPGSQAVLETEKGPAAFRVAGVFRDFFMGGGRVVMSRDTMARYFGYADITAMQIFLKQQNQTEPVIKQIQDLIPASQEIRIRSGSMIKENILSVFNQTFVITSALQILTAIVALTGILNSIMALLLERTRELGILRACGGEKGQLVKLLLTECGIAGLLSGIMAVPVGAYLAWILVVVINQRSFGWSYDMVITPQPFIYAVCFVVVAAVSAGYFPARHAGKIDIGSALRME